jgi:hypothetical protein
MTWQFQKHYTREQAQALLPQIRQWLEELCSLRQALSQSDQRLPAMLKEGRDIGGDLVNRWVKTLCQLKPILREFQSREIQIKDLERGLIDFPAILAGKEVFLCWEKAETDIQFWHELDAGYAARERLEE